MNDVICEMCLVNKNSILSDLIKLNRIVGGLNTLEWYSLPSKEYVNDNMNDLKSMFKKYGLKFKNEYFNGELELVPTFDKNLIKLECYLIENLDL